MRNLLGRLRRPISRSQLTKSLTLISDGDGSTLSLDFTSMSSLDSRFTFTRASTATYINSSGYVTTMAAASTNDPTKARFDYDPTTLAPRGLLIEGSATNELQRSNEFNTSPWYTLNFNTPTIASPSITDPAGGTNTWYCVPSGAGSVIHGFRYNTTFTAVAYSFSIWAKAAQHDKFVISDASSGQGACRFDLTAKTANVITGIVTPTNPQIIEYPNGWFRCSFTMVMAAATRGMTYSSYPTGASIGAFGATFTATGTDGMYFYGAQTEIGSGASSYIPTGASTAQRALEVCSMTGTNFSSWYTQGVGTVLVFSDINFPNTSQNVNFLIQDATAQNYARAGHKVGGGTAEALLTATSGSIQGFADTGLIPSNTVSYKTCYAWEASNFAAVANNGTVGTDTSGSAPGTVDRMFIGGDGTNSVHAKQGHVAKLVYWPTRLPNATMKVLTA